MLISCGASRHIAPANQAELIHFVLFIRTHPDGSVTHSWERAEDVDRSWYAQSARARRTGPPITLVMNRNRDCAQENRECIRECMSRPLSKGFGHITSGGRGRGGKEAYCNDKCMQPYLDCVELQDLQPRTFTAAEKAVDWLEHNHTSVLVGTVFIIAGVTFVVVSAGAGLVILAPAVLLTSVPVASESLLAEVP